MAELYEKMSFVVKNLESEGFFLVLDFLDANPEFTRGVDYASKYASYEIAKSVIKRVEEKGFTMKLKVEPLQTIYRVGV